MADQQFKICRTTTDVLFKIGRLPRTIRRVISGLKCLRCQTGRSTFQFVELYELLVFVFPDWNILLPQPNQNVFIRINFTITNYTSPLKA